MLLIPDASYEMIPNRSTTASNGVGEQIMTQNNLPAPISSSNNKNNRVYETVHTT